jgi:hypothetical protein
MSDLTYVTGLWENKTKKNATYLSGSLGFARLVILPNEKKERSNQPDYNLFVAPKQENRNSYDDNPPPPEEDVPF